MKCSICGENAGIRASKTNDGSWLCASCLKAAGGLSNWFRIKKLTTDEIKQIIEEKAFAAIEATNARSENHEGFLPTRNIGKGCMLIDESAKKVQFPKVSLRTAVRGLKGDAAGNKKVYDFSDVIGYEIMENNTSVMKGGIGSALAGALTFGETGAIVGGLIGKKKTTGVCESLQIKVTINDFGNPAIFIELLSGKASKSSGTYKNAIETAGQIASALEIILHLNSDL